MRFVHNDGGRSAAGFKGSADDCVTRAVAIAAELPYADVYRALADCNARTRGRRANGTRSARSGIFTNRTPFKRYMESLGWQWTPTMSIGSGCTVHMRENELPAGRLIVSLSRHLAAVINGTVHDTHDPSRGGARCVYGYWSRP